MDFADHVAALAAKARKVGKSLQTEEATKTALIMPFIQALGYDIFNPEEVIPEFIADIGEKKGEKVDYAICSDGKPIIIVECKAYGSSLDVAQGVQLERYFQCTAARIGILTDGNRYRFFSDLEETNKMDRKPYMEFVLEEMDERLVQELRKLAKGKFDVTTTLSAAEEMKYSREFKRLLAEQMDNPEDDFIRFFVTKVYEGKFMQSVKERFAPIVKSSLHQFVNERINDRLKSAMTENKPEPSTEMPSPVEEAAPEGDARIITSEEEWHAFYLVKSLLMGTVSPDRVTISDAVSYCNILLDGKRSKPLLRLHFNNLGRLRVGLFDGDNKDEKLDIATLDDILPLADRIRATARKYDE